MIGEKDSESSQSKLTQQRVSEENLENPDEKIGFAEKGIGFLRESDMCCDGFPSKPSKIGNSGSQELTLSYLCDNNSKPYFPEKNSLNSSLEKGNHYHHHHKGKEVISETLGEDDRWVERDFLQLNEMRGNSSKREVEEETERENRDKKPKLETLNLSLALPDVSLSLTASNALQNADPHSVVGRPKPSRSIQSLAPSNNNTQTTCSNDFTAASLSYSYSHPFSHNPSCSLTRNSTENYDYSADQIWYGGEGTNGSVHSRFKPIGDGVALSNFPLMQGNITRPTNKDSGSIYRTTSSDNHSFFPSELPAKPRLDNNTQSGDSRGRASEPLRGFERSLDGDGGGSRARNKLSRPERIIREIVSESIPNMAQIIQELPDETIAMTKEYLKNLVDMPERKQELVALQNRLERRSDLTKETLSKANKNQLDILVAVKMGLGNFLATKNHLPSAELVEIFLLMRCRNVICKSLLPVDDCECKICSANKGFCSSCMCPVCLNFDCASNTCSWVGCDACSHWCHAICGIQRNLIKPGPSLKGPSGTTTEMQFHCLGCGHASEMFGFVKDVFLCCAKDWGLETLIKELDCVRKIFKGSEDFKGKELQIKAEEMLSKLQSSLVSPADACNFIIQFFNYTDGLSDVPPLSISSKDLMVPQATLRKEVASLPSNSLPSRCDIYNMSSSSLRRDLLPHDLHQSDLKSSLINDPRTQDEFQFGKVSKNDGFDSFGKVPRNDGFDSFGKVSKNDGFDSLQSIVRIKEAEARMFQSRADEARREAEGYRRLVRARAEKLEEEYTEKLSKLCLQETEERRRKKLEELKILENSHCDYYNMKMRMQAEIAGLLERMEATKQQLV